jgi:hypothetical protein
MIIDELHYNHPQLRSAIIGAPNETAIIARGGGKTEGIGAPKTINCYLHTMPRGCGVIIGASFTQILTRTLPGLAWGWEKMGYKRDVHFIVGRKPPEKWIKKWNWKGPFRQPFDFKYFISWWNGAGIHLVSQDRAGSANGITIDWIYGDEAKLLNAERFRQELVPANRGIIKDFENNPYHHGITLTTDMPVGTAGRWLLDKEGDMDKAVIQKILDIQYVKYLMAEQVKQLKNRKVLDEYAKQVAVLDAEINDLRKGLTLFHEASALENIHALGFDYIKQQIRDSSQFEFDTQIMNKRPTKIGDGFYPDLDEDKHGYISFNYKYIDTLGYDPGNLTGYNDCRKDGDVVTTEPLHIGMDYNRAIWPLEVLQISDKEIRAVKSFHVLYPNKLKEVLVEFIRYYLPHKEKVVYYWYDQTATSEYDKTPIYKDVIKILSDAKWTVIPKYIGAQPKQDTRYRMWGNLLKENGKYDKVFRINRENCKYLLLSMNHCEAEQKKDGFGKNKKPEQQKDFPPEEAPHHSDALDTPVYAILESNISKSYNPGETGSIITT